jgi:hypothetical protein
VIVGIPAMNLRLRPGESMYLVSDTSLAGKLVSVGMASVDQKTNCDMLVTTDPDKIDSWYKIVRDLYLSHNAWGGPCNWPVNAPVAFANMSLATAGERWIRQANAGPLPKKVWIRITNEGLTDAQFNVEVTIG